MERSRTQRVFIFALVLILLAGEMGQGSTAVASMTALEPGITEGWLVQYADARLSFAEMSQHSLRMGSDGYPRVVYGGDHLYYAYQDATGWHTETADSAWTAGSGAALALDASGNAHISYYDAGSYDLKYATNKYGAWQVETVAAMGYVGRYSDIAIDYWGDPAIVYFDSSNSQLRYIFYDSDLGDWGPDVVAATGVHDPGHTGWFSFALDTSVVPNKPHISFYKTAVSGNYEGALYYATYANGWVTDVLDYCPAEDPCHAGEYNSLALYSKRPSVAYSYDGFPEPKLMYTAFTGVSWAREYVWPGLPKYVTLGMDTTGYAHITYQDGGYLYTRQPGPGTDPWTSPVVIDGNASSGQWSSMALPVLGTVAHALYFDPQTSKLNFVDHDRSGWLAPYTVATHGSKVGKCSSLAIDRLGRAHISYWDESKKNLLYARYNGSLLSVKRTIDASETAACVSVMAVNPATNNPVVALVKGSDLYYATYNAAMETWQAPILVDSGIDISNYSYQHLGMALRADGTPVFAYIKNTVLVYAQRIGALWGYSTVATDSAGAHLSLAMDSSGHPHILFEQKNLVKNATNPGTGWVIEPLGEAGKTYYGASLATGPSGQVAAAFLSTGGYQMQYASRICNPITQACSWTAPVMANIQCEEYFSLALDSRGTPHAACMNANMDLQYVTREGNTWMVRALDSAGATGMHPAIALSPSGQPCISYYDDTNDDLKFALKFDVTYLPLLRK